MDILRAIAAVRTPLWDGIMNAISMLGQETAFIVIGMIVLWCVDKKFGYRFLFMYIAGAAVNQFLKAIFMIPRPWVLDPDFKIVEAARADATGYSFPSGHTQSAVLMYGGIAQRIKKGWAYAAAAVLALLVAFSRMYLGVHTLLDVGVSLVTGLLIIILCSALFDRIGDGLKPYAIASGIVAAVSLGLIVFIMTYCRAKGGPDATQVKDACVLFGTAFGLFAGSCIEKRFVNFSVSARWWVQIIKVVLGIAVILGLRIGLKPLLGAVSSSPLMDCVRYFIMSFVAIAVYPLLFKPLSKLGRKKEAAEA
ncbi:MAG: phosphatase PAP2 family protein [Clostridia bacterium]|nr:phosphatase PAP2 family protein [Clostridia bacterium]